MYTSVLNWLDKTVAEFNCKTMFYDTKTQINFTEFNNATKSIGTFIASKAAPQNPIIVMGSCTILTPACFLGVVRAGCFYVPMDASMPVNRLNQIIDVIKSDIMIVDRTTLETAGKLNFHGQIFILEDIIDTPHDEVLLQKASGCLNGNSPLYVIFTSGSTGVPKGVITSHHSLMCYIDSVSKVLDINSDDILANQSPLDYIATIRDLYFPIKTGASTVIIPMKEFSMPLRTFEILNEYKVTTLCWSTPGIELPAQLGAFDCCKPNFVKKICFSGAVMHCKYLKIWQENLPDALYVNQYGPTEATASATYYVVNEKVDDDTVLPIGVPYDNYRVFLLNEDNTATADGQIGEICITGPILALGYYGNPEKTAETFIQNPLNKNYRELIYKTGDLGRFREDGILEFHGRKDRQIKHMGHRIELGEIEETAKKLSGISECCALYYDKKSILYLFYAGNATTKDIKTHFKENLPPFMTPRKVVQMENLPLLPNGKIDMQTLKTYFA